MDTNVILVLFNIAVLFLLALDLKFFHRKGRNISILGSVLWTVFWVVLALCFNAGVYYFCGSTKALEFLSGYLIEKSLSVDNLFVFLLIFSYFNVPQSSQYRVLFWGILGALVLRAFFIFVGITLISMFHWMIYLFGAILIYASIKMIFKKDESVNIADNSFLKLLRKFIPVTKEYEGGKFFTRENGKLLATPLIIVLLVVEASDIMFAFDSVPAVFSVTLDPFIVYTSNVFAILGLRALFFVISGIMKLFCYLNYGLSAILAFVGFKLLIKDFYDVSVGATLCIIVTALVFSIIASVYKNRQGVK